jgi:hypothetical protein
MGRKAETKSQGLGRLRRAADAVKRVFTRGRRTNEVEIAEPVSAPRPQHAKKRVTGVARPARREADIPLDVLDRAYTPPLTSSKTSFRSDGADHHQDQDFTPGAGARWNDEDHYTNKSGDPRIGTRGRTYEANESREEQR